MGFLGISGSSWLGALGGIAGTMYQNSANQASAQASMDFQREVLQNRNQWAVEDLKKAGLNPILAAGATNSSAQGAQAQNENPATSAISSASQANAMKLAQRQQENQDKIADSVVDLNTAKAVKEREQAADFVEKRGLYGLQGDMFTSTAESNRANVDYLGWMSKEIGQKIELQKAEIAKMEKERDLLVERVNSEKAGQERDKAAAKLSHVESGLAQARTELTKTQEAGEQIDNRVKALGVGKAENKARYEKGAFGDGFFAPLNREIRGLFDIWRGR